MNGQNIANMITSTWIDSVELDFSSEQIEPAFPRLWSARFGHVVLPLHTKSVSTERAKTDCFPGLHLRRNFFPSRFSKFVKLKEICCQPKSQAFRLIRKILRRYQRFDIRCKNRVRPNVLHVGSK